MAKGDHLYKGIWFNGSPMTHHGIDCGDGYVIEFQGKKKGGRIAKIPISAFYRDRNVKVKDYKQGTTDSPDIVVKRAKELLDPTKAEALLGKKDYCFLRNNCEHLATYCKTGLKTSEQIKQYLVNPAKEIICRSGTKSADRFINKGVTAVVAQGVAKSTTKAITKTIVKSPVSKVLINTGLKQAPKVATTTGKVVGGAVGMAGIATGFATDYVIDKALKDDVKLSESERKARKAGRTAGQVGTTLGAVFGVGIGSTVGGVGAIVAGAALAPIALGGLAAFGVYKMCKKDK